MHNCKNIVCNKNIAFLFKLRGNIGQHWLLKTTNYSQKLNKFAFMFIGKN